MVNVLERSQEFQILVILSKKAFLENPCVLNSMLSFCTLGTSAASQWKISLNKKISFFFFYFFYFTFFLNKPVIRQLLNISSKIQFWFLGFFKLKFNSRPSLSLPENYLLTNTKLSSHIEILKKYFVSSVNKFSK